MKRTLSLLLTLCLVIGAPLCTALAAVQLPPEAKNPSPDYTLIPFLADYVDYKYDGEINALYLVCTTAAEYFPNSFKVWDPLLQEHGIKMDLLGPPEYSDASLIATLESSLASQRYDIVVLYPISYSAITPLLDDIWSTYKVPILAYAFAPETQCGHYYLGTSYYTTGTVQGQAIIDYVDRNSDYFDTLDEIPVVTFVNPAGSEQYARIVGALDILEADGRFRLIQEYVANGEAACLTAMETVLTEHPEVEVVLTQIDNDVVGAYQAIVGGTYKHSEYISLWGYDATGAVCSLMKQDGERGAVQGSSYLSHEQAGEALIEIIPILVGAAKEGLLIEFEQAEFDWLGTALSNWAVTVTPLNIDEHYKP